ncbi:hypothetical protein NDU88_000657 [Pleurodeles waltl]|uniref:Uncharacterized protein n=1 Tax=Pleurodeles waltl TaxID=8319 RepID=A0AAV7V9K4_PLEWA|nr:hypothetical protein NDU88_000657 [Pleurodeles waltl]
MTVWSSMLALTLKVVPVDDGVLVADGADVDSGRVHNGIDLDDSDTGIVVNDVADSIVDVVELLLNIDNNEDTYRAWKSVRGSTKF